jgi:hypothetical protein
MKHSGLIVRGLITFFGLAALAFSQQRPLDTGQRISVLIALPAPNQTRPGVKPTRLAM